jgi:hypothetical protein
MRRYSIAAIATLGVAGLAVQAAVTQPHWTSINVAGAAASVLCLGVIWFVTIRRRTA